MSLAFGSVEAGVVVAAVRAVHLGGVVIIPGQISLHLIGIVGSPQHQLTPGTAHEQAGVTIL